MRKKYVYLFSETSPFSEHFLEKGIYLFGKSKTLLMFKTKKV